MSTELVRRAKALRLCKEILQDESREQDMEQLIHALESQGSHIEGLVRQEEVLKLAINPNTNLIPLQPRSKVAQNVAQKMKVYEKRFIVTTPSLIEGSTAAERKKLAFEIHLRTSNSVFIDLGNLPGFWDSNLDGLENGTLFIPSIETLSLSQQDQLQSLLNRTEFPLVIGATNRSYAELKTSAEVSSILLSALAQAHFRLQRPVKEYLELGFFKLFLESLS